MIDLEPRRRDVDLSPLYATLVDSCPEPLLVTDAVGNIVAWNAAAHALAPAAARAALPRSMRIESPVGLTQSLSAARNWSGRLSVAFAADRPRPFDGAVSPLPRIDAEPQRFLCLLRGAGTRDDHGVDCADQARLQALVVGAPVMLWMSQPDQFFEWFNPRWLAYTGRTLDELRGRGWLDDVHPEDVERCPRLLRASCETRQPFTADWRLRRFDGSYRWMLFSAAPRFDADGRFRGHIGSAVDIDERKQLEDRLTERVRTLRHAERRQAAFLAMLSHELRSPLAPIANAASVLRTLEDGNPRLVRLREILERQVHRLGHLVDDLIDVTRSAQGQISLVSEPVAVDAMVRGAVARSADQINAGGHQLDVRLSDNRLFVKGDCARLSQAMSNLISNAAKFTRTPGTIEVAVGADEKRVRIAVRDHGQGIAARFLPHVFELFAQQDPSSARTLGGLGVGLTLARRIAQMHGGDIEASSAGVDCGAELIMTLPLADAGSIASTPQGHGPGLAESYRVLIIEDDDDAREALRLQMRMWGNEVRTAATGEEGLEAAVEFKPHIVLCDIGLPGMDGLQLIGPLRERLAGQPTLYAAVTGCARSADETRALALGFDSFLVKPLRSDGLAKLLRSYASRVR